MAQKQTARVREDAPAQPTALDVAVRKVNAALGRRDAADLALREVRAAKRDLFGRVPRDLVADGELFERELEQARRDIVTRTKAVLEEMKALGA